MLSYSAFRFMEHTPKTCTFDKKHILTLLTLLPFYPNLQIFHLAQIIKVPDKTCWIILLYWLGNHHPCVCGKPILATCELQLPTAHALITPNFPSGSSCEIVGDYVEKINVGPPLFTLLQPKMPTDGVRTDWCDQPLNQHNHTCSRCCGVWVLGVIWFLWWQSLSQCRKAIAAWITWIIS